MSVSYQDALAYYEIDSAHPGGMALTKKILQNEKINHHTKILDAGCGTGQTSCYLANTFSCKVYSIDNHPEMIKTASRRFAKEHVLIDITKADIENLPFSDDSFDYIIAESSTAFTDIPKSLAEYFRVLKPDGILLNTDMVAEQTLSSDEKADIINFYGMNQILAEEDWVKAIKMAGFKTVDILKSNSVLQALEEYIFEEDPPLEQVRPLNANRKIEDVIHTHQKLLLSYGEKLGYRVFKSGIH